MPDPQPPASLGEIQMPQQASSGETEPAAPRTSESGEAETPASVDAAPAVAVQEPASQSESPDAAEAEAPRPDPIAELAQAASERFQSEASATPSTAPVPATPGGEWEVQVGSFGEAGNAERLQARLQEQGFPAYSRHRDNGMTTVYVGPFDSSDAGERAISAIKQQINEQGLLVRVRD